MTITDDLSRHDSTHPGGSTVHYTITLTNTAALGTANAKAKGFLNVNMPMLTSPISWQCNNVTATGGAMGPTNPTSGSTASGGTFSETVYLPAQSSLTLTIVGQTPTYGSLSLSAALTTPTLCGSNCTIKRNEYTRSQ